MKRKLKIAGIVLALIVTVPIAVLLLLSLFSSAVRNKLKLVVNVPAGRINEGIYKIVDNPDYPDAYIKVSGKNFQVFNFDMNVYWRQQQYDLILRIQNNENTLFDTGYTESQLWEMSDLNKLYVDKPYRYDPQLREKEKMLYYNYPCLSEGNLFGVYLVYDALRDTLILSRYGIEVQFKK